MVTCRFTLFSDSLLENLSLTAQEQEAAGLVPRQIYFEEKEKPPSGSEPEEPLLAQYYALEAKNFADGSLSFLDIRNAISAEYGPVPLEKVVAFFRELETSGNWVIESD